MRFAFSIIGRGVNIVLAIVATGAGFSLALTPNDGLGYWLRVASLIGGVVSYFGLIMALIGLDEAMDRDY